MESASSFEELVQRRTSLIAWANDAGVKVYDAANNQLITFVERPRGSPCPEILLPHLVWQVSQRLTKTFSSASSYVCILCNCSFRLSRAISRSKRKSPLARELTEPIAALFGLSPVLATKGGSRVMYLAALSGNFPS
ncbi:hypothetical protein ACOSQ3_032863 [Xanthoceras sorbifolium]